MSPRKRVACPITFFFSLLFLCYIDALQPMILKGSVNIAVSVDGFIATKDGNLDWLNNQPMVEGEDFGFSDFLKSVNVMIMGRNTFDTVVGFGPEAWLYGDLPIFVWTRNAANVQVPDWVPATVTVRSSSSPKELWNDVQKNQKYTHAYVDGGKTIQSFLKAGLIHRLTLTRIPILLGDGIPLFGGVGLKQSPLQHISTKSYSNGFVISTYDVAHGNDESCPSAEETS